MHSAEELRITPPEWLRGEALRTFEKNAAYMDEINVAAGYAVYDEGDVEALALMSVSYQKSLEHLASATKLKQEGANRAAAAENRARIQEDGNYQSFMRLLRLDPQGRAEMRAKYLKRTGGFYMRAGE